MGTKTSRTLKVDVASSTLLGNGVVTAAWGIQIIHRNAPAPRCALPCHGLAQVARDTKTW